MPSADPAGLGAGGARALPPVHEGAAHGKVGEAGMSSHRTTTAPYEPVKTQIATPFAAPIAMALRALPALVLVAGAVFVASQLNHGWIPWDDGTLAQSAQRVLDGELPQRDFAELYMGRLSFLNAGVF